MSQRIRYAFTDSPPLPLLEGIVEADETYVGGKIQGVGAGTALALKTPVVTLVQRDGDVRSQVMNPVTSKNLSEYIWRNVGPDSTLMTDSSNDYNLAGQLYPNHETVDHGAGEYVRGQVHINTAEGFFSQFKRSLDGTHHHVSAKHLHHYAHEFDFRYNTRKVKDGERTIKAIRKSAGKRLMYRQATGH
jgi:transposase-like protein